MRLLVSIASYGDSQVAYLQKVLDEFLGFSDFKVDININTDIDLKKKLKGDFFQSVVKLKDFQYLPFHSRRVLFSNTFEYDLFLYTENDILWTEKCIKTHLFLSEILKNEPYLPCPLRFERRGKKENYPDDHRNYNIDPNFKKNIQGVVFGHHTNHHSGGFLLTRRQLLRVVNEIDFLDKHLVPKRYSSNTPKVHACTNIYTETGLEKVFPLSDKFFYDYRVEHLSAKYTHKSRTEKDFRNRRLSVLQDKSVDLNRLGIIKTFIKKTNAIDYLEIGCDRDQVFSQIKVKNKIGVDPIRGGNLRTTSDSFFAENIGKKFFDVIFIDGLHHAFQVQKDIENALKCLKDGGVIICHDMKPETELMQRVPRASKNWTGDCWKAWCQLRATRKDLKMFVVDCDYGVGVIMKGEQKLTENVPVEFKDFQKRLAHYLNLVPVYWFLKKFEKWCTI